MTEKLDKFELLDSEGIDDRTHKLEKDIKDIEGACRILVDLKYLKKESLIYTDLQNRSSLLKSELNALNANYWDYKFNESSTK